jgi:hypothetical protein
VLNQIAICGRKKREKTARPFSYGVLTENDVVTDLDSLESSPDETITKQTTGPATPEVQDTEAFRALDCETRMFSSVDVWH